MQNAESNNNKSCSVAATTPPLLRLETLDVRELLRFAVRNPPSKQHRPVHAVAKEEQESR